MPINDKTHRPICRWVFDPSGPCDSRVAASSDILGVGAELVALEGELERRLEEAQLVAGVVALAFEGVAVDLLLLEQLPQAVGELQFAACAQFRGGEHLENCRCQDVASDDGRVRGRVPRTETSAANCRSRSPTSVREISFQKLRFASLPEGVDNFESVACGERPSCNCCLLTCKISGPPTGSVSSIRELS
jgi:hypothetical protein